MDVLVPWLVATTEAELIEALQHLETGAIRHQSIGKSSRLSYDDGSNLRIPSTKKGQVVQITKFLTYEDPIQVSLSDTVIRINATIANYASQKYAKENRKKVTDGTVGGLIQLQDFEIVATHHGPRDKRLTLYVETFKSLDSIRSGTFGVAPQAITDRLETKDLLDKLKSLRNQGSNANSEQSAAASPIRSQLSTQISEPVNDQASPFGFATQLTRSVTPSNGKPKPSGSTTNLNIRSTFTANSAKPLAPPTNTKPGIVASTLGPPQVLSAQKQNSSSKQALLGLLQSNKRAPTGPEIIPEPRTEESSTATVASNDPITREKEDEVSGVAHFPPNTDHASRAPPETQKRRRQSPESSSRKKPADNHKSYIVDRSRQTSTVDHDLENRTGSGIALTEASVDLLRSQPNSPSMSVSEKPQPNASRERSVCSIVKPSSSSSARNIVQNRISSRDVNIPKDQEILLSRAESWLPAEPGQREPSANIPISTLRDLNSKADLRARRLAQTQTDLTTPANALPDPSADSDSDEPVSSGQWPPSPERDQLPPDSSLSNAEHSDHSIEHLQINLNLVPSAGKQSRASISSQSNSSRHQSPVSASYFSRESRAPSMASSGLLSPGDTSTSAGEGINRSMHQGLDFEKSLEIASGLEAHINHHPPSIGVLEDIECSVGDRTKPHTSLPSPTYHAECGNANPLNYKGGANSTTAHAYQSATGLNRSWSEHGKDRGQKSEVSGTGNESDSVEASGSKLPLMDRGSTSPRNHENVHCSNMGSLDGMDLLTNASPALVQPVQGLDEETVSPLLPASPISDSDLEMTVPLALNEGKDSVASSGPMERVPSTASQPQEPFTQVQRTPYVNGRVQNESLAGLGTSSTPLTSNSQSIANGITNDDTEFVSASFTSGLESSTAEANVENGSSHKSRDHRNGDLTVVFTEESNSREATDCTSRNSEVVIVEVELETSRVESAAAEKGDSSLAIPRERYQSSGLIRPVMVAEASMKNGAISEGVSTPKAEPTNCPPQSPGSEETARRAIGPKRKVADAGFMFPDVAKPQKKFKVQSAFTITERPEVPRDPSEGARQYRQDFLASRRSSASSTPVMSPTIPTNGFVDTMPEIPRDPLERARQFRQEFLASRMNSETSTPTTSPLKHISAPTGAVQVNYRTANVGKDVEQVIVQNQSADNEAQHERLNELSRLAAKSQKQESRSDAVPLSNGITGAELDTDRARPVSQSSAPLNNGAESSLFASQDAQNADVETPRGKQATAIEPSFHALKDIKSRAQSLEIDVDVHRPHPWKTGDGAANARDEVDETINSSIDIESASHHRVADGTEEGRLVAAERNEASKISRADEVAGQGSVSELKTTAMESPDQTRTIEENLDAQTLDRTALEPRTQQQSMTIHPNAPTLDDMTAEPMFHHQLVRKNTIVPTPVVQSAQGVTSPNPGIHADRPTNKSAPLSSVVPALVTDPNNENQEHFSPAGLDAAILQSRPMPNREIQPTQNRQEAMQFPIKINAQKPLSVPQCLFENFKATYPSYTGDEKHFASVFRKLSQLVKANKMEHSSLWDDFIIRHKTDYAQYLRQCAEEAEDAITYEVFYQTRVERPRYEKQVINRQSLEEALSLVLEQPALGLMHRETIKHDERDITPLDRTSTLKSSPVVENSETLRTKSSLEPVVSSGIIGKPSRLPVVIDLTEDDLQDNSPKRNKNNKIPNQHSLPISANGTPDEPPPRKSHGRNSGSPCQALNTSAAFHGSHVVSSPKSVQIPVVPAEASARRTGKRLRQSLPWERSSQESFQTSPDTTPSNTPQKLPESQLQKIRTKESNNAHGYHQEVSKDRTAASPKQNPGWLNTCNRVIQSNWGIKAHELLEPEYCRGQVWSTTMVGLLAEIASRVHLREARDRIKKTIDDRVREYSRQKPGHANQDRKILKSDLEVVRGIVETSSTNTLRPLSPPHTDAAVEKQSEDTSAKWWEDDNSPFKSFCRAYLSIQPGKGNSFAEAGPAEPKDAERVDEAANTGIETRRINIMRWNL